jgi:hypothetical protein
VDVCPMEGINGKKTNADSLYFTGLLNPHRC